MPCCLKCLPDGFNSSALIVHLALQQSRSGQVHAILTELLDGNQIDWWLFPHGSAAFQELMRQEMNWQKMNLGEANYIQVINAKSKD